MVCGEQGGLPRLFRDRSLFMTWGGGGKQHKQMVYNNMIVSVKGSITFNQYDTHSCHYHFLYYQCGNSSIIVRLHDQGASTIILTPRNAVACKNIRPMVALGI